MNSSINSIKEMGALFNWVYQFIIGSSRGIMLTVLEHKVKVKCFLQYTSSFSYNYRYLFILITVYIPKILICGTI